MSITSTGVEGNLIFYYLFRRILILVLICCRLVQIALPVCANTSPIPAAEAIALPAATEIPPSPIPVPMLAASSDSWDSSTNASTNSTTTNRYRTRCSSTTAYDPFVIRYEVIQVNFCVTSCSEINCTTPPLLPLISYVPTNPAIRQLVGSWLTYG